MNANYESLFKLIDYQMEDSRWSWMRFGIDWLELHSRARDDLFIRIEPYGKEQVTVAVVSAASGDWQGEVASSVREALDIMRNYMEILKFKGVYA